MRNGFLETNGPDARTALVSMFAAFEANAYPEDLDTIKTMSTLDLAWLITSARMQIDARGASPDVTPEQGEQIVRAATAAHTLALSELTRRAEVK